MPNLDRYSLSDPFAVLFKQEGKKWVKLGRTEWIDNNVNPVWKKKIALDFQFELNEMYKVKVYDRDDPKQMTKDLSKHSFCGETEFTMHEVVNADGFVLQNTLVCDERAEGESGTLCMSTREAPPVTNQEIVIFKPSAVLETPDACFMLIYREISPGKWLPVYKSESKKPVEGRFDWNQAPVG